LTITRLNIQHSRANDSLPEEQNERLKESSEIVVTINISCRQRSYTSEHLYIIIIHQLK